MEKIPRTSGNRPNPGNESVHRHGHMSISAGAGGVHGSPRSFNLKQQDGDHEKSFRKYPSFCGRPSQTLQNSEVSSSLSSKLKTNTMMRRPKTHPELLNHDGQRRPPVFNMKMNHPMEALSANKLLVNVTAAQSIGPLRLLLSADASVEDVIKSTLLLYAKEGRRPLLSDDPASFGLHYSQFSIHSLKPADKVNDLGSRKFFMCAKATANESCRSTFHDGEITASSLHVEERFRRFRAQQSRGTTSW